MPVIALAPESEIAEKLISNLEELKQEAALFMYLQTHQ
jgi:glucosamine 6-phosphate synthetase-like amidotransferase/phosphosugar isomerase protein